MLWKEMEGAAEENGMRGKRKWRPLWKGTKGSVEGNRRRLRKYLALKEIKGAVEGNRRRCRRK